MVECFDVVLAESVMEQRGFSSDRSGVAAAEDIQRVLRHHPPVATPSYDSVGLFVFLSFVAVWMILG